MGISTGLALLRGRYRLVDDRVGVTGGSESWVGVSEDHKKFLLRLWPYSEDEPPDLLRALWDAELRTLYRVASAPGADQSILVIRDAGLDRMAKCFVMVLEAEHGGGYVPLTTALDRRDQFPWLDLADLRVRRDLWLALAKLAEGVALLHGQNILHRNIDARQVYFNPDADVQSLRLGGFEWSVRLGVPATESAPANWATPPEFFTDKYFGYRPETDWYAYGMLAARCFRPLEGYESDQDGIARHRKVLQEIFRAAPAILSDLEKDTLLRMVAEDPDERISDIKTIRSRIEEVVRGLETNFEPVDGSAPLVLAINPKGGTDLLDRMNELGFVPDPVDQDEMFNPNNRIHVARFTQFIQRDLNAAEPCPRITSVPNRKMYVLEGKNILLLVKQFEYVNRETNRTEPTWNIAFCLGLADLRSTDASRELVGQKLHVMATSDVLRNFPVRHARNWEKFIPKPDPSFRVRADLARFYTYIRCTNQIELLMRDAEIFAYELVGEPYIQSAKLFIELKERSRPRPVLDLFSKDGGLPEFLQTEIASGKLYSRQVVLTENDSLIVDRDEWHANSWMIERIDPTTSTIKLSKVLETETVTSPPSAGYIRGGGMRGQVPLIQRRKKAIDRLERHSFLLRSLSAPGQVYMDTGPSELPVALSPDQVDLTKQAAIQDILRVRPIYLLQGPPGTGKTTLVAHLLRQIFEEDPVAQVLITAQAHPPVDVLRAKVQNEAFSGVPEQKRPLAIRIGNGQNEAGEEIEGSVRQVGLAILRQAQLRLESEPNRSLLQDAWHKAVSKIVRDWESKTNVQGLEFFETVKRGASITYCTTSASDLEVLAESTQSFDWAVVEEAGKTYAFDLALPLQLGHRWLLIGDHNQLPPYKFEDVDSAIVKLDEVTEALQALPGLKRHDDLVDIDWIRTWTELDLEERENFKAYVRRWLNAFKQFFQLCSRSSGEERLTTAESVGGAAGKLTEQHRMHPTIGHLISTVFYEDRLINRTEVDGSPLLRVTHPLVEPAGIEGKAIIWIDTKWAIRDPRFEEIGRAEDETPYKNIMEADALVTFIQRLRVDDNLFQECALDGRPLDIVALAPYRQQVALLNNLFDPATLPAHVELSKSEVRARGPQFAHTIDSFQGNQADIVCVSLVRNNPYPSGEQKALGFLADKARLNVLLSRAKRVLILVGSWEFFQFQLRDVDDEYHPWWHWKHTISLIEEDIRAERAIRIAGVYSEVQGDAAAVAD